MHWIYINYFFETQYHLDYNVLLYYFFIALGLGCLLIFVNANLAPTNNSKEKSSPYECGFEPFNDARIRFNIHYFIVALLFIVFDAELVFFFPWSFTLNLIGIFSFPFFFYFFFYFNIRFFFFMKIFLFKIIIPQFDFVIFNY